MADEEFKQLKRSDLIEVLRDLEILVVSLDRIGSSCHELIQAEQDEILRRFIADWDVFRRLAWVRGVLSEAFPREAGEDGMDELEREFQDLPHWTWHNRQPPPDFAAKERERRWPKP